MVLDPREARAVRRLEDALERAIGDGTGVTFNKEGRGLKVNILEEDMEDIGEAWDVVRRSSKGWGGASIIVSLEETVTYELDGPDPDDLEALEAAAAELEQIAQQLRVGVDAARKALAAKS